MSEKYFEFKEFTIFQNKIGMPLTTDSVIFGAAIELEELKSILDIGCGTGILSLMLAQRCKQAKIDAVELDKEAAIQAKNNFQKSKFSSQITLYNSDIQTYSKKSKKKYNLILSNPPYYQRNLVSPNEKKQKARHGVSLDYVQLANSVNKVCNDLTRVWLIIPYSYRNELIREMIRIEFFPYFFYRIKSKPNYEYNRIILAFSQESLQVQNNELTIYDTNNDYTKEFKNLTKSFYKFIEN